MIQFSLFNMFGFHLQGFFLLIILIWIIWSYKTNLFVSNFEISASILCKPNLLIAAHSTYITIQFMWAVENKTTGAEID